jgi:hypothetical protein
MKRLAVAALAVGVVIAPIAMPLATAHAAMAAARASRVGIVVVAGQSNAEGYESYAAGTGFGLATADRTVRLVDWGDYSTSHDSSAVALDTPQVLAVNGRQVFGPEVGIARYLWSHGHQDIAIAKVTKAGSALAAWRTGGQLLTELGYAVSRLKSWEKARGVTATVVGIVWMQGETDSLSATTATPYRAALASFLPRLRDAVHASSRTPIVLAETTIAPWVAFQDSISHDRCSPAPCASLLAWNRLVRDGQRAATKSVGRTFVVDSATYARASIQIHLNARGELDLGKALGKALARRL